MLGGSREAAFLSQVLRGGGAGHQTRVRLGLRQDRQVRVQGRDQQRRNSSVQRQEGNETAGKYELARSGKAARYALSADHSTDQSGTQRAPQLDTVTQSV